MASRVDHLWDHRRGIFTAEDAQESLRGAGRLLVEAQVQGRIHPQPAAGDALRPKHLLKLPAHVEREVRRLNIEAFVAFRELPGLRAGGVSFRTRDTTVQHHAIQHQIAAVHRIFRGIEGIEQRRLWNRNQRRGFRKRQRAC
ncbi:MAG: hypothetical protein BWY63_03751 [Chloroflexi bacterium ADurb.Bin360]|nr:MAG: hypothetical protein BWY63_03751 [Chloroflexi bacterium ADurb.Bin360]